MKILYIANIRLPTEKAHGIQIMKMCEAFAGFGNEVELIIPKRLNPIKTDPFEHYGVKKEFKITKIACIDFIFTGLGAFFILEYFSFLALARIYLFFKKYDVIYTRDTLTGLFFKNFVLELHSLPKKISELDKKIYSKAKKIVVLTSFIKKELAEIGVSQEKILVSPDSVDLAQFEIKESVEELRKKYNLPKNKKIITYAGKFKTMGQSKGVEDIIKSFPEVIKENGDAYLLLVGVNEDEVKEINKTYNNLGINKDNGKAVGHVPQKDLFRYMKASDVLVMNFPNTKHYAYYMSPLKLFEYMASGKPIVSSDLPSVREILNEQNSILVKADDMKSLTAGINLALKDSNLTQKISDQAGRDIQNYTWKKRAEGIIKLIKTQ